MQSKELIRFNRALDRIHGNEEKEQELLRLAVEWKEIYRKYQNYFKTYELEQKSKRNVTLYENDRYSMRDIVNSAFKLLWIMIHEKVAKGEKIESMNALLNSNAFRTVKTNCFRQQKVHMKAKQHFKIEHHAEDQTSILLGFETKWNPHRLLLDIPDDLEVDDLRDLADELIKKMEEHGVCFSEKEEDVFKANYAGLSGPEAAKLLAMSEGAYRRTLGRARAKVREALKDCERRLCPKSI